MKLILDKSAIIWPGNTDKQPPGFMIPTHLKVLTIEEKPFVYVREIQPEEACTSEEIRCPHFNNTNDGTIKFFTYLFVNGKVHC
jgi:ionotropic glutamate receptor NMDA 1